MKWLVVKQEGTDFIRNGRKMEKGCEHWTREGQEEILEGKEKRLSYREKYSSLSKQGSK